MCRAELKQVQVVVGEARLLGAGEQTQPGPCGGAEHLEFLAVPGIVFLAVD